MILALAFIAALADTTRCYRASRPLGTSVAAEGIAGPVGEQLGESGAGLRTLETFRLLERGRADRPGTVMERWWLTGSTWRTRGDTLHVLLSTRLVGWSLALTPLRAGSDSVYTGVAQYVSDVIARDSTGHVVQPHRVSVRVTREACTRITTPRREPE